MSTSIIRGQLYFGAITNVAGASGTLIGNLEKDELVLEMQEPGRQSVFTAEGGHAATLSMGQRFNLVINLRELSDAALDVLYTGLRDAVTAMRPGQTPVAGREPQFALIVRPKIPADAPEDYLYGPLWSIAQDAPSRNQIWSRLQFKTDKNPLKLVANENAVLGEAGAMVGTAAEIAAEFASVSA